MATGALQYLCPECERKLAPVGGLEAAAHIVYRTCSGCRGRWQIALKPMERGRIVHIDEGTFTRLHYSVYD